MLKGEKKTVSGGLNPFHNFNLAWYLNTHNFKYMSECLNQPINSYAYSQAIPSVLKQVKHRTYFVLELEVREGV